MIKIIVPIIKSPPPTNSPKVVTTLPGSPVPKISFVEDTFNAILNMVVNKRIVGKKDISKTSFTNIHVNKMVNAMAILNASKISSKPEGTVMMNIAIAVNKYIATPKSAFFIEFSLPFSQNYLFYTLPCK